MRNVPCLLTAAAVTALISSTLLWSPGPAVAAGEDVAVWMTTGDQSKLLTAQPGATFGPDRGTSNPYTITVDESQVHQQIDGVGATHSDGPASLINSLPADQRENVLKTLYSPTDGIGLSVLRQPIGGNDLATKPYTYNDLPAGETDPTMARFSIAHDFDYIIPQLKRARELNTRLSIMSSPWGVPGWMKTNGQLMGGGGHLTETAYQPLAEYFVRYVKAYAAQGLPVFAVSPTNEPQFDSTGYPSVLIDADEQARFIRENLGPSFAAAGLDTKILAYDHNWNDRFGGPAKYPQAVLGDPTKNSAGRTAASYISGISWHCYSGPDVAVQTQVRRDFPAQDAYGTECAGGTWEGDRWADHFANTMHLGIQTLRNEGRTVIRYVTALNPQRGPRLNTAGACSGCRGLLTIDPATGAVTRNGDYYGLGHLSKFIVPGARRIGSNSFDTSVISDVVARGVQNVATVAARNPDGGKVLVVYNGGAAQTVTVRWGAQSFDYAVPAGAAATFTWGGRPTGATHQAADRIHASHYSAQNSTTVISPQYDSGSPDAIGYTSNGSWLAFAGVDFGADPGASAVSARVAQDASGGGGTIQLRLDSPTGPSIGTISLGAGGTGGWQNWRTVDTAVSNATGVHTLYAVFTASINLNWLSFTTPRTAYGKLYAGRYSAQSGISLVTPADAAYPGEQAAGWASPGSYLRFDRVNFGGGASRVQVRVASGSGGTGGLEFRLGSPTGTLLGTASVPDTGGWQSWQTVTAPVSATSGVHDLFVVFSSSINLNWVDFSTAVDDSTTGTGPGQFTYQGSGWGHCTGCDTGLGMFDASNSWSAVTGDTAKVAFQGTGITLTGCVGPAHGIAGVSVDGNAEQLVDFHAPSDRCDQPVWRSRTLPAGAHTLTVRVTGTARPGAGWTGVNPDRVDIAE